MGKKLNRLALSENGIEEFHSIDETKMKELNLPFVCELGSNLDCLANLKEDATSFAMWQTVRNAEDSLIKLLDTFPVAVCRREGEVLKASMSKFMTSFHEWITSDANADDVEQQNLSKNIRYQANNLTSQAKTFRTVLLAELETLRAYLVFQKGIYSTTDLIGYAEKTLPENTRRKISPEAIKEIRESGKCLAFECPTASGFHILRAAEVVLYQYYLCICRPKSNKKLENWGAYLLELRSCNKPEVSKVVALLQQIKDLDRNVIMHPEMTLASDEAFKLFELTKSAIILMAESLKVPRTKGKKTKA